MFRNIQHFRFSNYTTDDLEETNLLKGGVIFNIYQNLPNVPSSAHNDNCDYSVSYDLPDAAIMQNSRNTNFPFTLPSDQLSGTHLLYLVNILMYLTIKPYLIIYRSRVPIALCY